jgi:hypothetical protein
MNRKSILFLSLSIITSTTYLYPESLPWYSRIIAFVQRTFWNPFVKIMRRLFRTDQHKAVQAVAMLQRVQREPSLELFELVLGGPTRSILDIQYINLDQKFVLVGLFDGNKPAVQSIKQELVRQRHTSPLNEQLIPEACNKIKDSSLSKQIQSATGFVMLGTQICLFNIGNSQTLLFRKSNSQVSLIRSTQQRLVSNKTERATDRLAPGIYYVILATKSILDAITPEELQESLRDAATTNTANVLHRIETTSKKPFLEGRYIVVHFVIK